MQPTSNILQTILSHTDEALASLAVSHSATAFAVLPNGPDTTPTYLPVNHLTLIVGGVAADDRAPGKIAKFQTALRESFDDRLTDAQVTTLFTLCGQHTAIEAAEDRDDDLVIFPDGEVSYVTGPFELSTPEAAKNAWVLLGDEHVNVGDLASALRCAQLLRGDPSPSLLTDFPGEATPTEELLFVGHPGEAGLALAHAADPTPSVIQLFVRPTTLDDPSHAHRLSRGIIGHLQALTRAGVAPDPAALAATLTATAAPAHPFTVDQIETLLSLTPDECAFAAAHQLLFTIAPNGALRSTAAGSILQRIRGQWHLASPQSAPLPSFTAALLLADLLALYVQEAA